MIQAAFFSPEQSVQLAGLILTIAVAVTPLIVTWCAIKLHAMKTQQDVQFRKQDERYEERKQREEQPHKRSTDDSGDVRVLLPDVPTPTLANNSGIHSEGNQPERENSHLPL